MSTLEHLMGEASATRAELMVLRAIWSNGAATRAEIGKYTGLSRPTVVGVLSAWRERNLISGSRRMQGLVGRDAEVISINSRAFFGLGVDVGGTKTAIALVDLCGEIVAEATILTPRQGPKQLVDSVVEVKKQLLASVSGNPQDMLFAAIGIPGILQDNGQLINTGMLSSLEGENIRELFEKRLACEVKIENDVNMAAVGELLNSESFSCGTRVLISVGTGLGMGIVHSGEIFRGATGHAGEIAYLPLARHLDSAKLRQHGAAELLVSGPVLESRYKKLAGKRSGGDEIMQAYLKDDAHARVAVDELVQELARIVVSVVVTLDPEVVVMAGGLGSNVILYDPLVRAVSEMSPLPVKIEVARFGSRAGVVGAAICAQRNVKNIVMTKEWGPTFAKE